MITKDEKNIVIKEKNHIYMVALDKIIYFEKQKRHVSLETIESKKVLIKNCTLKKISELLPGNFVQTHQSFVVNKDYIVELTYSHGNMWRVVLKNNNFALAHNKKLSNLTLEAQ